MAKVGDSDPRHFFGGYAAQSEYELREAKSEISRHHKLITEMQEALEWSLMMIDALACETQSVGYLAAEDRERVSRYQRLLNRQVS